MSFIKSASLRKFSYSLFNFINMNLIFANIYEYKYLLCLILTLLYTQIKSFFIIGNIFLVTVKNLI